MLVAHSLRRMMRTGRLTVIDAAGKVHEFGETGGEPAVTIRLHDKALHTKLFLNPHLYLGEAYMDGTLTLEAGTLRELLDLCGANAVLADMTAEKTLPGRLARVLRPLTQHNPIGRARRNAAHHYDLSDTLYESFLDKDREYSCAYFLSPNDSLEQAQENKKRHIAAKLLLKPGCKVLDIGSGWGGLGLYLARVADADVTGVTLSEEQHKVSNERAAKEGLHDRVRFFLRDYREEPGRYERIVSVGMFEHVGAKHFPEFFGKIVELLTDDGVALLHSIGRFDEPGITNPWIRKYIFPGSYVPALSAVLPAVESCGLFVTDIEILRLHYAETLNEWSRRFQANRERIREIYDERFCRMWEFYLAGAEMSFRRDNLMVFQMQLAKSLDAVPLTRDYIVDWERRHLNDATQAA